MPLVKVNGIAVEVPQGTNMIEAAKKVGVEIPHYCYHPHLSVAGNCRMCLVDVEAGGRRPDIACNKAGTGGPAAGPLFEQGAVDREVLRARIPAAIADGGQVSLSELAAAHPYEPGLTELMAYLSLAGDSPNAAFSDTDRERVEWTDPAGPRRAALLPRVVFTKEGDERAV